MMPVRLSLLSISVLLFLSGHAFAVPATLTNLVCFADANSARIEATVEPGDAKGPLTLEGTIVDDANQVLWKGQVGETKSGTRETVTGKISVSNPQLWSPAHPKLYKLTVAATKDSGAVAQQTVRFGFRSFESRNGQFYLNGKPIFLKGIAINPPGRTIPDETGESRQFAEDYVRFLREKNVNIIRMTHDSQVWFDVCDELGMMIYQGQYGAPLGGTKLRPPTDFDASIQAYKELFGTYARHPSVLIYVLSNELPVSGSRGKAFHDYLTRASAELKAWDPNRLIIGDAGYGEGREGDVCDVHRYWGWYYNTFLTYYNLRDQNLFTTGPGSILKGNGWDEDDDTPKSRRLAINSGNAESQPSQPVRRSKNDRTASASDNHAPHEAQPITFTECVGNFTGPSGEYNIIMRKQLGAQLNWTGHSPDQREDALEYQSFMAKQAAETFRRLRPINPNLAGLMPFSIFFYNWSGVTNFHQMKAKPALDALAAAYQPVLLSWELWTPQVYSGTTIHPVAHVINDSEEGAGITNATLQCQIRTREGQTMIRLKPIVLPKLPYYQTWSSRLALDIPDDLPTGEYILSGLVMSKDGRTLSRNECALFVAARRWSVEPGNSAGQEITLYDPSGRTAPALRHLQVRFHQLSSFKKAFPSDGALIIGEDAWNKEINDNSARLKAFIRNGGRILCLKQNPEKFDASWLPEPVEFFTASANSPAYPPRGRPFSGSMRINPERPEHPVFNWLNRRRFNLWSDYSNWEQTRPGFPNVFPVTAGFKLTRPESLEHTAILANYDRGLDGIALCEMFDGRGSVILSGFDIMNRAGLDPVADRFLANLAQYAASKNNHEIYPLVDQPIHWGNYSSERGVITGPLNGMVVNATWVRPPTNPTAQPLTQDEGAWNTRPGDQFSPHGRSPFGPYGYNTGSGLRDLNSSSEIGTGVFWVRVPPGKRNMTTLVENPSTNSGQISISVNGGTAAKTEIAPGKTETVTSPLPAGETTLGVRLSGSKKLVLLQTTFE